MKKVQFKYDFLLFLYAYLRQMDLSLDRSRWEGLSDLRVYYKTQLSPQTVTESLIRQSGIRLSENLSSYFPKPMDIKKRRILGVYNHYLSRKHFLKEDEITYCCELLNQFSELLLSNVDQYDTRVEKLRNEISSFNYNLIESKLLGKDVALATSVEHYLQNVKVIPITEFLKGIDL
ncbi:hypothetical protein [Taibaiella chishuiensis]|uniref:Uncharacterized protein n=1 Tax=Taibaiella chishuiensis TaxID=1434707 RepID=A0A2P8CPK7_9BACT|nr:hypothetical protein [Taibaiella chishuiensis]PSK86882.1 hypothetical protein B0I18_1198 [Taibaiella chishuiensis]